MTAIQRNILISLVPILGPLTAFAETDKQTELVSPVPGTKGNAASWRASQIIGLKWGQ